MKNRSFKITGNNPNITMDEVHTEFLSILHDLDGQGGPYQIHHRNLLDQSAFEERYRPKETQWQDDLYEIEQKYATILDLSFNSMQISA